jgi:D-alanine-D-alanine ligase and related ATP-grasp enzymes
MAWRPCASAISAAWPSASRGERWDFVFNICEGLAGAGREAQVPALLEAYGIPCSFSDSLVMALCLHKGLTKHVLRDKGIPTAPFAVIETMADLDGFTLPFPSSPSPWPRAPARASRRRAGRRIRRR